MEENIDIDDFCRFYKEHYHIGADRRYSNRDLWKIKAYCYAATKVFGISTNRASQAIHKDHTTLMHHMKNITEDDKINGRLLAQAYLYVTVYSKEEGNGQSRSHPGV